MGQRVPTIGGRGRRSGARGPHRGATERLPSGIEGDDDGFLGGLIDYIDYVVDALQVTRPRRARNPASATPWTPLQGLQIRASRGHAFFASTTPSLQPTARLNQRSGRCPVPEGGCPRTRRAQRGASALKRRERDTFRHLGGGRAGSAAHLGHLRLHGRAPVSVDRCGARLRTRWASAAL